MELDKIENINLETVIGANKEVARPVCSTPSKNPARSKGMNEISLSTLFVIKMLLSQKGDKGIMG